MTLQREVAHIILDTIWPPGTITPKARTVLFDTCHDAAAAVLEHLAKQKHADD